MQCSRPSGKAAGGRAPVPQQHDRRTYAAQALPPVPQCTRMHLNSETSHSILVIDSSSNFWLKPCDIAQVIVQAAAQRYGITTMARRSLNCRQAGYRCWMTWFLLPGLPLFAAIASGRVGEGDRGVEGARSPCTWHLHTSKVVTVWQGRAIAS